MAHEKLRPQYFFDEAKIEQLKLLAPECFEDGKINFETLKQNLGDWTQDEEDPQLEHFGLFWPGKRDARKAAALPPEGTLEPVWGEGLKADGTPDTDAVNDSKNLFIEGENLEVLKLLQKSYAGKIKMIYIDPPYNTGNDFVYDDDFTEPLQEYLRRTGQIDEEGKVTTTNKRSDGRFHSKWLSMIYPRLRLARNLLRDDGSIFISIDDNEVHNLQAVMNEVFGEENFVAKLIWQKKTGSSDATNIAVITEYILVFSKQISCLKFNQDQDARDENRYRFKDDFVNERGPFYYDNLDRGTLGYHKSLDYGVEAPDGKLVFPNGRTKQFDDGWRWKWGKDKLEWGLKNGFIEVQKNASKGGWGVYYKIYLNVDNEGNHIIRSSPYKNLLQGILNTHASNEAKEIFGKTGLFSNPKPSGLIKKLLIIGTNVDDIVLDFFAGSATTAHAVLDLNKEDGGNRKFICIQIPEVTDEKSDAFKAGYKTITEVSKDRIKRVIKVLKEGNAQIDLGCKLLSLKSSNYKSWTNYQGTSVKQLEIELEQFNRSPLQDGHTNDGLLSEIMLLEGFTLCSTITPLSQVKTNSIKKVSSEFCQHDLLICLDEQIDKKTVTSLQLGNDDIFICLDSAISTEDKLRLSDKGLIKTI